MVDEVFWFIWINFNYYFCGIGWLRVFDCQMCLKVVFCLVMVCGLLVMRVVLFSFSGFQVLKWKFMLLISVSLWLKVMVLLCMVQVMQWVLKRCFSLCCCVLVCSNVMLVWLLGCLMLVLLGISSMCMCMLCFIVLRSVCKQIGKLGLLVLQLFGFVWVFQQVGLGLKFICISLMLCCVVLIRVRCVWFFWLLLGWWQSRQVCVCFVGSVNCVVSG